MYRTTTGFSILLAVLAAGLTLPTSAAAAGDTQGFIYGRVTAESGTVYEGRLRWNGDEEAFWGDIFNSTKEERPYMDEMPERSRRRKNDDIKIFGLRIGSRSSWGWSGASFRVRFGDMKKIEVRRGDEATVTMKNGTEYDIDGGSNDLGGKIYVWDGELGEVQLKWDRLETIEFMSVPPSLDVSVHRLHGKLESDAGTFEGYIQWDQEECLSTDKLDGEGPDGDMSIEMGKIRSIERRSRSSSRVTLWSGREFTLSGTNDVDNDNRGIYVEDSRYGRVLVDWGAFERLDFSEAGSSGPSYDAFEPAVHLSGTVTADGEKLSGKIVFDIDEYETWEFLNGDWRDVEYSIPFALIASITPRDDDSSRVMLKGGEELLLEDSNDVDEDNSGILVLGSGKDGATYIEWDDVERIDFDH